MKCDFCMKYNEDCDKKNKEDCDKKIKVNKKHYRDKERISLLLDQLNELNHMIYKHAEEIKDIIEDNISKISFNLQAAYPDNKSEQIPVLTEDIYKNSHIDELFKIGESLKTFKATNDIFKKQLIDAVFILLENEEFKSKEAEKNMYKHLISIVLNNPIIDNKW